jgi:hypothetical protein
VTSPFVERLECTATAPRRTRAWIARTLAEALPPDSVTADRLDDIAFCAAEVVTMAVVSECATVDVRLVVEPGCVRVTVSDDGPLPREGAEPAQQRDELGLRIVSMLADRYGVDPTGGRQARWLEFDLDKRDLSPSIGYPDR